MSSTRAAVRYAKAILEIADSKDLSSEVSADMALIASTIKSNSELSSFIQNPLIVTESKKDVLLEVFASVNSVTKSLFQLLLVNKRFDSLLDIALEYNKLLDIKNGVEVAEVTTAIPMDAALEAKVSAKVGTFSESKKITIKNIVDPTIIGGFILKIGDKQYNASIANRLQVLKRELSN